MMSDNTELGSAGLLAAGVDPAKSTHSDWKKAATLLTQQRDAGLVSQYYDQSYIKALETGDIWITQAWSGDIFQANATGFPHLKFVAPKEGVMLWTDTMMIPLHAQNPVSAMEWINFYYQPKIAAEVADWVNYICPVPAAQKILRKEDPPVGNSPLVFPTKAESSLVKGYYNYTTYAEYNAWNNVLQPDHRVMTWKQRLAPYGARLPDRILADAVLRRAAGIGLVGGPDDRQPGEGLHADVALLDLLGGASGSTTRSFCAPSTTARCRR